jgi:hypothetical protein
VETFEPIRRQVEQRHRMDMPGAHSSCDLKFADSQ